LIWAAAYAYVGVLIYIVATLTGLVTGVVVGFGTGLGAAHVFQFAPGARDGGPGMAGFLRAGPFGALAGFLFGFGAVLRWGGGDARIALGCWIGGATLLAAAAAVVFRAGTAARK
jgi:hypothetical protein